MKRSGIKWAMWAAALAVVLTFSSARADTTGSLFLGGPYSGNQGGSFYNSTWTPVGGITQNLSFVFCIDIPDEVAVSNSTYDATTANNIGVVTMSNPVDYPTQGIGVAVTGELQADVQVAWLLHNYSSAALVAGGNSAEMEGLQEAIWDQIYGNKLGNGSTSGSTTVYTWNPSNEPPGTQQIEANMVAALNLAGGANATNYVSDYLWFTPLPPGPTNPSQALVGFVPDGGMTLMLLGGALVGLETLRRKFRV